MVSAVEEALALARLKPSDISAVGVGSPGPLDTQRGVILYSANMDVRNFALGPGLSTALGGLPVLVENDVRVGGWGEYCLGAGRGHKSLLAAFMGTGLGGCVIVDGQIVRGVTDNAGEIGHTLVKVGGPQCGCGRRGCLEAFASRTAITRRLLKAIGKGQPTSVASSLSGKTPKLKSRELAGAFQARDAVVVKEVERAARYLGLGLGSLVNVLGPEIVVIGGGVVEALGAPFLDLVKKAADDMILADPEHQIRFAISALGDDAGILGASLLARQKFEGKTSKS
jgi:glucokinase